MDENSHKKVEFNRYINSPEILASIKSSKYRVDNSINIKSNLFNAQPKKISKEQLKNFEKINPKINLFKNEKKLNEDYLKYFLNDFNSIIFVSNINNINKNIYKIKLESYFNILKKLNEKKFSFYDSLIEKLINETSNQIEKLKQENNINYISLLSEGENDYNLKEIKNETMNLVFIKLNSKLKQIKDYYSDLTTKTKRKNDILKLRKELKEIYKDLIGLSINIYKNSPLNKIGCYQKIIDDLKETKFIPIKKIYKKDYKENKPNATIEKNLPHKNLNLFLGGLFLLIFVFIFLFKLRK